MYYKSILTNWYSIEISRNEWDIDFWGLFGLLQKMAAKFGFWEIGEREFQRDPKKYTFGKSIFKTFFQNRISQILPPFLSTLHTWMDPGLLQKDTIICREQNREQWISVFIGAPKTSHGPFGPTWTDPSLNLLQTNYYKITLQDNITR